MIIQRQGKKNSLSSVGARQQGQDQTHQRNKVRKIRERSEAVLIERDYVCSTGAVVLTGNIEGPPCPAPSLTNCQSRNLVIFCNIFHLPLYLKMRVTIVLHLRDYMDMININFPFLAL